MHLVHLELNHQLGTPQTRMIWSHSSLHNNHHMSKLVNFTTLINITSLIQFTSHSPKKYNNSIQISYESQVKIRKHFTHKSQMNHVRSREGEHHALA
jgi:hypothetical protein